MATHFADDTQIYADWTFTEEQDHPLRPAWLTEVLLIFLTPVVVMDNHRWARILPLRCGQLPRSRGGQPKKEHA